MTARILSIQVGLPRQRRDGELVWRSAIDKRPAAGSVALSAEGLAQDGVADRRYHGGPERALLAYCAEHYPGWREELGRPDLAHGAFGENLTVSGLAEEEACIGDVYAQGAARIQISQPRLPCVKLARHLGAPGIVARALETGRSGIYLRVLEGGALEAGELLLVQRPCPGVTVAMATRARLEPLTADAEAVRACALLSEGFRDVLHKRRDAAARA